ncbi:MAG: hypothetical protein FWH05_01525 [Oscillospiraceae bacterium]|nr:hypothetical protein [Oscillospiraceae bacterium]
MRIALLIDKLTPCLEEVATGEILQTTFSITTADEITKKLKWNKHKN